MDVITLALAKKFAGDAYTKAETNTLLSAKADLVNGEIPIAQIPNAAIEREVVVADDTARFALTTAEVQLGDTVKVESTNKMYFVRDTNHLDGELGYSVYVAGKAAEAVADQNGDIIDITYVKVVSGKQLSTEDFTTAEKTKLANLANYDDSAIYTALDDKVDKVAGRQLSTENYTTAEKTKLANLENYDDTSCIKNIFGTSLASGDDLNTYTTAGTYACTSGAVASSLINCPYTGSGFRLDVLQTSSVNFLKQIIQPNQLGTDSNIYHRTYAVSTDSWSPWYKIQSQEVTA